MGREILCRAHWGGQVSDGKALLETEEIIFRSTVRGALRSVIRFGEIEALSVVKDCLRVNVKAGVLELELGSVEAEKWVKAIRSPKSVLDKIGIKAGQRAVVLGKGDDLSAQLRARGLDASDGKRRAACDLIFVFAGRRGELSVLESLKGDLKKGGAIWVLREKGSDSIGEMDVLRAGRAAGLVDVKVVAYSKTHAGAKLVLPSVKADGAGKKR